MKILQLSIAFIFTLSFLINFHSCLNEGDKKIILDGHNNARAQVRVGLISWDNKLEAFAQDVVDKAKPDCVTSRGPKGPYGMNLAAGYGASTTLEVINEWALTEKSNYNYASNSCVQGQKCSSYTQVVWRNSVRVGCGSALCGAGWPIFVCVYDPAGNIAGQRPY